MVKAERTLVNKLGVDGEPHVKSLAQCQMTFSGPAGPSSVGL